MQCMLLVTLYPQFKITYALSLFVFFFLLYIQKDSLALAYIIMWFILYCKPLYL